jgi:hypothetical protein
MRGLRDYLSDERSRFDRDSTRSRFHRDGKFGYSDTTETPNAFARKTAAAAVIHERAIARELVPIHSARAIRRAIDRAYQLLNLTHPFVVH